MDVETLFCCLTSVQLYSLLIDHATLIDRLSVSFGIRGMALNWCRSYLSGRKQCVAINGDCSPGVALTTGVPQSSVLGPVLFSTYLNPVRTLATPFGVKIHQFSDDTQEYLSFPILHDFLGQVNPLTVLANCASSTTDWSTRNKVSLIQVGTFFYTHLLLTL